MFLYNLCRAVTGYGGSLISWWCVCESVSVEGGGMRRENPQKKQKNPSLPMRYLRCLCFICTFNTNWEREGASFTAELMSMSMSLRMRIPRWLLHITYFYQLVLLCLCIELSHMCLLACINANTSANATSSLSQPFATVNQSHPSVSDTLDAWRPRTKGKTLHPSQDLTCPWVRIFRRHVKCPLFSLSLSLSLSACVCVWMCETEYVFEYLST
jgi:hypothetical protein